MSLVKESSQLLIATTNRGKFIELSCLLSGCSFNLISLTDLGIDDSVPETGETFGENATIKAVNYSRLSGILTLADDSGLEVEALGGEPGVHSARYAGPDADDSQRIAFLLQRLNNISKDKWRAHFRCAIALASPCSPPILFFGECEGQIVSEPRGTNGFGYDPVFFMPELGKTMAQLTLKGKNRVSHRARAVRQVALALENIHSGLTK